jgi:hypothetical protein
MDGAFGRDGQSGEPPDQALPHFPSTPGGVFALDVQDVVFNVKRKLAAKPTGPAAPVRRPLHPTLLITIEDFVTGLAGDTELSAKFRHHLAGEPQTAVSRPSPSTSFQGIASSPMGGSVTYVSGTNCYPCVRPLIRFNNLQTRIQSLPAWSRARKSAVHIKSLDHPIPRSLIGLHFDCEVFCNTRNLSKLSNSLFNDLTT